MNSMDRMRRILAGEPVDRVPFYPFSMRGFAAKTTGYAVGDSYADPEKSFRAQMLTREMYDIETLPTLTYASFGPWELGGAVKFPYGPRDQAPTVTRNPVASPEDVEELVLPEVAAAGIVPLTHRFAQLCRQNRLPAVCPIGTPFNTAVNVAGAEVFFRWMVRYPDTAHALLRKVTDFLVGLAQYFVAEFGAENVLAFSGGALLSNQMISPKQFEKFVLPYMQEINVKVLDLGIPRIFQHICGDQNRNIEYYAEVPFGDHGIISCSEMLDMPKLKATLGTKAIIGGNVD
jgi:uroporphyrinogen decarboxylase